MIQCYQMNSDRYKWLLLAFLFVTFFLELGTRQVYNAVLPQLKIDFAAAGVNDAALGTVGTVFGAVFGMTLLASGLAADFFGRKRVIVLGTALFSAAIFGSGFAGGLGLLMICYGVLNAMGQCCVAPASYSLISQYHDNSTRSTAMAIFQTASYAGIILCSWLSGVFADAGAGGWRKAFWLFGAIGLVWAIVMQWKMRDTKQPEAGDTESVRQKEGQQAYDRKEGQQAYDSKNLSTSQPLNLPTSQPLNSKRSRRSRRRSRRCLRSRPRF